MTDYELIAEAVSVVRRFRSHKIEAGQVGAAILTAAGNVHRGVCIDAPCGIGFCAEHAAIAAMVTAGETLIAATVAVDEASNVLAPCGRCREFIALIDEGNRAARILLPGGRFATLAELMPDHWIDGKSPGGFL